MLSAPSEAEMEACEFRHWYPLFTSEKQCCIPSVIIPLPEDFVDYLLSDGVVLPEGVDGRSTSSYWSDDEHDTLNEVKASEALTSQAHLLDFTALNTEIGKALRYLKGNVFPKLNWSAPYDAAWINCETVKCSNLSELYMLLKSSDRVVYDIEHMLPTASDSTKVRPGTVTLVLRRWIPINTCMEFRCFVLRQRLIGISQRECSTYFPFLAKERYDIVLRLQNFFDSVVKPKFHLASYTFDVYIDDPSKIWLVDFNVFGAPTNPLLFDWNEIILGHTIGGPDAVVECRVVCSTAEVIPSTSGQSRGPIDVSLSKDFPRFMEKCRKNPLDDEDDSSDTDEDE